MRLDTGQIEVVDDMMADVMRRKTHAQRLAIGFAMWRSAKKMLTAHLKADNPDWDERRLQQEVAKRLSHGAI